MDGGALKILNDFSFNQSWIASVIGVDDEISLRKVEIPKDWKVPMDPLSLLLKPAMEKCQPDSVKCRSNFGRR